MQPELLERELRWAPRGGRLARKGTWLGDVQLFQISLHRWERADRRKVAAAVVAARRRLVPGGREGVAQGVRAPPRGRPNATVAPFASGGIDVRSWALAHFSSHACRLPWNDEYQAACDGDQGYDIARCLAGLDPATARRFAPPTPAADGAVDPFDLSASAQILPLPRTATAPSSTRTRAAGATRARGG